MSCKDKCKDHQSRKVSGQVIDDREVFTRYYAKLCEILPRAVEELLPHLVTSNIISFEEEEEIVLHSTKSSKARAILLPIRKALFEGIPRPFYEFLSVMQSLQHLNLECAELAGQICAELNLELNANTEDKSRELNSSVWLIILILYNTIPLGTCREG